MNFDGISLAEAEFMSQNQLIGVIPKFKFEQISLISGTFGPFKPQTPLNVPLWLALELKKKQMCDIQTPGWLDEEVLQEMIEVEKQSSEESNELRGKLPDQHFFEIAIVLLDKAAED